MANTDDAHQTLELWIQSASRGYYIPQTYAKIDSTLSL
jgi:hypothetical protein